MIPTIKKPVNFNTVDALIMNKNINKNHEWRHDNLSLKNFKQPIVWKKQQEEIHT